MIAAVMMCRDEQDVIVPVLTQLVAQGVDRIWVFDNMSCDKTRPLLDGLAARLPITVIDDDEPGYYQPEKLMDLAARAATEGADWILPFDADEFWFGGAGYTIGQVLNNIAADVVVNYGYDHIPRRDDPDDPDPIRRMGWRRTVPQRLPKVAYRWTPQSRLHYGNHDVDHPGRREHHALEYRHYGYRSLEQMIRKVRQGKAALDAAPDVHPMYGSHWRTKGAAADSELAAEWEGLLDEQGLVYDPAPLT